MKNAAIILIIPNIGYYSHTITGTFAVNYLPGKVIPITTFKHQVLENSIGDLAKIIKMPNIKWRIRTFLWAIFCHGYQYSLRTPNSKYEIFKGRCGKNCQIIFYHSEYQILNNSCENCETNN